MDKRRDRGAIAVDAKEAEHGGLGQVAAGAEALVRRRRRVVELDLLEGW